jgi:FtsH-binding integral membrane protein
MESAKNRFRVEVYFYVTCAIFLTAAWVMYLARSEQVR